MDLETKKSNFFLLTNISGFSEYISQRKEFESEESLHQYYLSYDFQE